MNRCMVIVLRAKHPHHGAPDTPTADVATHHFIFRHLPHLLSLNFPVDKSPLTMPPWSHDRTYGQTDHRHGTNRRCRSSAPRRHRPSPGQAHFRSPTCQGGRRHLDDAGQPLRRITPVMAAAFSPHRRRSPSPMTTARNRRARKPPDKTVSSIGDPKPQPHFWEQQLRRADNTIKPRPTLKTCRTSKSGRHNWSPWRRAGILDATQRRDCNDCRRIQTRRPPAGT